MTEPLTLGPLWNLAQSWVAGTALGGVFFGGLWLTVHRLLRTAHPARWVFGSLLLRSGIALVGFYVIAGGGWQCVLLSMVGFVMARQCFAQWSRTVGEVELPVLQQSKDTRHAP
jgi:F1F0 ATPase subunit 2